MNVDKRNDSDYGDYLYEQQRDLEADMEASVREAKLDEIEKMRREERKEIFRQEVASHQRDYNELKCR